MKAQASCQIKTYIMYLRMYIRICVAVHTYLAEGSA